MWNAHAYCSIRAIVVLGVDNNTFPNISQEGGKTAPCVRCLHYVCVHVYLSGGGCNRQRNGEDPMGIRRKNPQAALGESDTAVVPTAESTGASVLSWCHLGVGVFRHHKI